MVGSGSLGRATAVNSTVMNMTRVIGPAFTGWIVSLRGVTDAYGLACIILVLAWLFLIPIPQGDIPLRSSGSKNTMRKDVMEGIRYIQNNPAILVSIAFGFIPLMLLLPLQNLMVLFSTSVWQVGDAGLGLMMAAAGLGGTFGSLWIASRGESPERARIMIGSMLLFAALVVLFSLSPSFTLGLGLLIVASIGASATSTLNNTAIQLLTEDHQRGRVSAITMAVLGLAPLSV